MAVVTAYTALNLENPTISFGSVTSYSSTHITIEAGLASTTHRGNFTYDASGNVFGQLTSMEERYSGALQLTVTGFNLDYYQIQNLVQSDDAAGAYSYGLAGSDTIRGSTFNDALKGYAGNDRLYGNGGNDRLFGDSGSDHLNGGAGNDRLTGGAGNDRLTGGAGKDLLVGGTGRDVFDFNLRAESGTGSTTADVISDFTRGQDKIDLSTIDAFAATAFNNAFIFRGTAAFSSATAGEVRYQKFDAAGTANDHTMVFIDTDGDRGVEMVIRLTGLHTLTAGDFIL